MAFVARGPLSAKSRRYNTYGAARRGPARLLAQFVSHGVEQFRHVQELRDGLPGPEACRDIQGVLFLSCTREHNHLGVKTLRHQFSVHDEPIHLGHVNIGDAQVRRLEALLVQPLTRRHHH